MTKLTLALLGLAFGSSSFPVKAEVYLVEASKILKPKGISLAVIPPTQRVFLSPKCPKKNKIQIPRKLKGPRGSTKTIWHSALVTCKPVVVSEHLKKEVDAVRIEVSEIMAQPPQGSSTAMREEIKILRAELELLRQEVIELQRNAANKPPLR